MNYLIDLLQQIAVIIGCLATIVYGTKKIMNDVVSIVHDFYKVKEVVSANTSSKK